MSIAPFLPHPEACQGTQLAINPITADRFNSLPDGTRVMLGFLFAQRWALAPHGQQGLTWLECLVLFLLHGGTYEHIGMPSLHGCEAKQTLRQVLLAFTRNMRRVINESLPQDSQIFFKPSKAGQLRYKSYGFSNAVAAMSGNVANLRVEQKQIIVKHRVSIRHTFTRNSSVLLHQGGLKLKAVVMS